MIDALLGIVAEFWDVLGAMSPYLLFGFLVSGILSVYISPEVVRRHLGGKGLAPVLKASLFGVPLPLCSCGVIPVSASLRRQGASKGATTAFLLSTPQTGVDSIFVTLSLLGPVFAIFRPLAALLTGFIGGSIVSIGDREEGDSCEGESCTCATGACMIHQKNRKFSHIFKYGFVTLAGDIAKPLFFGLLAAALISALVPENFFAGSIGQGFWAKVLLMALGIPVYVCATASVPLAAALIAIGVSPGAAFVFLMTGPATNIATIATVWKVMGRRVAITYLATTAGCALLFGSLLDLIYVRADMAAEPYMPWMMPPFLKVISAIVLLAVLGWSSYVHNHPHHEPILNERKEKMLTLNITGMTCSHCVAAVKKVLKDGKGVKAVDVDLKNGKAIVDGENLDHDALCKSVDALGYGCSLHADKEDK
ncbi:MAG: SO_0444 family Cu/Zn efflux transporter [Candidatus Coatesbacteria bacterium]|nr:SO_0444 family Cu/Zn efflux transporter [Candidatus Coatesbacteria bacterium]